MITTRTPAPRRRSLSAPVRRALLAIAAATLVVIGWIAALNWNWLAPSLREAVPWQQAEVPAISPSGHLRTTPRRPWRHSSSR